MPQETVTITGPACMMCGQPAALAVTTRQADALAAGRAVHEALAQHPRPEREMLISGIHPKCWREAFGEPDTAEADE